MSLREDIKINIAVHTEGLQGQNINGPLNIAFRKSFLNQQELVVQFLQKGS